MPAVSHLRHLDDSTIDAIAEAFRTGVPNAQAAAIAGVTPRSLQRWVADGTAELDRLNENPDAEPNPSPQVQACVALVASIKTAEARFVQEQLLLIRQAATRNRTTRTKTYKNSDGVEVVETTVTEGGAWQAAAWLLERRNNVEFGRQVRQLVSGPDGGPVVTREERADRLASWLEQIIEGEEVAGELPAPVDGVVDTDSRAAGE